MRDPSVVQRFKVAARLLRQLDPSRPTHGRTLQALSHALGIRGGWNALLATQVPLTDRLNTLGLSQDSTEALRRELSPVLKAWITVSADDTRSRHSPGSVLFTGFTAESLEQGLVCAHPYGEVLLIVGGVGMGKSTGPVLANIELASALGWPVQCLLSQSHTLHTYGLAPASGLTVRHVGCQASEAAAQLQAAADQPASLIIVDGLPELLPDVLRLRGALQQNNHAVVFTLQTARQYDVVMGHPLPAEPDAAFPARLIFDVRQPSHAAPRSRLERAGRPPVALFNPSWRAQD